MKVSKYNTRKAASTPRKMHLRNPFTQEVLIDDDGKTIDFFVYGVESDVARNALKERDRKYGKASNLTDDEAIRSEAELLAAITQGWSPNLENDDGPIPFSREAAVKLYLEEDWIARQVQRFSLEIRNYDPLRLAGSAHGSSNSHGSTQSRTDQETNEVDGRG